MTGRWVIRTVLFDDADGATPFWGGALGFTLWPGTLSNAYADENGVHRYDATALSEGADALAALVAAVRAEATLEKAREFIKGCGEMGTLAPAQVAALLDLPTDGEP